MPLFRRSMFEVECSMFGLRPSPLPSPRVLGEGVALLLFCSLLSIATPASAQTNPLDPAPPTTQSTQRGLFRTTFYESSTLASKAESIRRFHWNDPIGEIELGQESFQAYVPQHYRPEDPCGLLVWISSGPSGFIPVKKWVEVLDKHHLIWIGANKSGNE